MIPASMHILVALAGVAEPVVAPLPGAAAMVLALAGVLAAMVRVPSHRRGGRRR